MAQGEFFVIGIIITIVAVGVGSAVGLAMLSKTDQVFQSLGPGGSWAADSPAGLGFNNTMSITYSSWPMLGLVVLAFIGVSVIAGISILR